MTFRSLSKRPPVSLLLAIGVVGVSLAVTSQSAEPFERLAPQVEKSCKPEGPIRVTFAQTRSAGRHVDLEFTFEPVLDLRNVEYEVNLPEDTQVVSGSRIGRGLSKERTMTRRRMRIDMPEDDTYREVALTVRGIMKGSDGTRTYDEPVQVTRYLRWGTPPQPGTERLTRNADGSEETVIVLPTRHRPGR